MNESTKDLFATVLGATTSIFAYATGFLKMLTLGIPVSVLNPEFGVTLITAFFVGVAGALGGLITRETYKLIIKVIKIFKHKINNNYEN